MTLGIKRVCEITIYTIRIDMPIPIEFAHVTQERCILSSGFLQFKEISIWKQTKKVHFPVPDLYEAIIIPNSIIYHRNWSKLGSYNPTSEFDLGCNVYSNNNNVSSRGKHGICCFWVSIDLQVKRIKSLGPIGYEIWSINLTLDPFISWITLTYK